MLWIFVTIAVFFTLFYLTGNILVMGDKNIGLHIFITADPYPCSTLKQRLLAFSWLIIVNEVPTPFFRKYKILSAANISSSPPQDIVLFVNKLGWACFLNKYSWIVIHNKQEWKAWVNSGNKNWNMVIEQEDISINSEEQALEYSKLIIDARGGFVHRNNFGTLILRSIKDVIGYDPKDEKCLRLNTIVYPPKVKEINGLYKVKLFAWHRSGGMLYEWMLSFTNKGLIKNVENNVIAEGIGQGYFIPY